LWGTRWLNALICANSQQWEGRVGFIFVAKQKLLPQHRRHQRPSWRRTRVLNPLSIRK
jgi:hypothetical protein